MKSIDTKSFLIGVLSAALIAVSLGAVPGDGLQTGRFQLVTTATGMRMFDTTTGDYYVNKPEDSWRKAIDIE